MVSVQVRAAMMVVAGVALLGFTDNFVRVIAQEMGLWQFHALRSAMALPVLWAVVRVTGLPARPKRWRAVVARCLVQALSMLIYFGCLPFLPIAQVGAGLFTAPLFVLLFSWARFGQGIGPRRIAAVLVGFTGIIVMLKINPADLNWYSLVPVLAGAFYGLSNLLTRQWCADEPVIALLAGFFVALGVAGALAALALALFPAPGGWVEAAPYLARGWNAAPSAPAWAVVAFQAVGSLAAVGLLARGYQTGETSYLTVFEYFFLISASFFAWQIWGETLDAAGFAGIALIILSGVIIAVSGARARQGVA